MKSERVLTDATGRKERASAKHGIHSMYSLAILPISVGPVPLTVHKVLVSDLI